MGDDELTRASRREHALYGELAAVYRGILEALTDERTPVDPVRLAPEAARAEAATAALASLGAALAPSRRESRAPSEVVALWQASAALAAEAAATNRSLVRAARARQARIAARCAALGAGRHALAGYRPAGATMVAVDRRA